MASEEWGIPPWQVEQESSQEWWERWLCFSQEKANLPKPK